MHGQMLEHLVGRDSELWGVSPAMALVLLFSVPSANPEIVDVRDEILSLILSPSQPNSGYMGPPTLQCLWPVSQVLVSAGLCWRVPIGYSVSPIAMGQSILCSLRRS